jgi:hypothetical protein
LLGPFSLEGKANFTISRKDPTPRTCNREGTRKSRREDDVNDSM